MGSLPDGAGEVSVVTHGQGIVPPVQVVVRNTGTEVGGQLHGLGSKQHQGLREKRVAGGGRG